MTGSKNNTVSDADVEKEFAKRLNKGMTFRSEERRVGKECRSRWSREH